MNGGPRVLKISIHGLNKIECALSKRDNRHCGSGQYPTGVTRGTQQKSSFLKCLIIGDLPPAQGIVEPPPGWPDATRQSAHEPREAGRGPTPLALALGNSRTLANGFWNSIS